MCPSDCALTRQKTLGMFVMRPVVNSVITSVLVKASGAAAPTSHSLQSEVPGEAGLFTL